MDILIKEGLIYHEGRFCPGDILISGGRIKKITPARDGMQASDGMPAKISPGAEDMRLIDARGCIVCSGFVDLHVHLREPGYSYKETIKSGSMAAARGGYTTVCAMPNLNPVPDSLENIAAEQEIIDRDAVIEVLPYASISKGRKGESLVDFAALKDSCAAFSDDGSGVQGEVLMLQAMREAAEADCIIAAHCEDNTLLKGGYIHEGEYARAHSHKGICSESEWGQIARDLELCARTGCRYHVCHISTRESVELIRRAKAAGIKVTCETAPHYLVLCEDDLQEDGRFKMNPPLRSASDREALIEGLRDGTIDAIATDHAPHSPEEKSKGLKDSAMGITGLETAFPVLYTRLVKTGRIGLARLLEVLTESPRRIFRLQGGLAEGQEADIVIIDVEKNYTIDSSEFLSKGRSTPFDGMKVSGLVRYTMKSGRIVYNSDSNSSNNNSNNNSDRDSNSGNSGV